MIAANYGAALRSGSGFGWRLFSIPMRWKCPDADLSSVLRLAFFFGLICRWTTWCERKKIMFFLLLFCWGLFQLRPPNELRRKNTNSSPHTVDRLASRHSSAGPYQYQHKQQIAVASHWEEKQTKVTVTSSRNGEKVWLQSDNVMAFPSTLMQPDARTFILAPTHQCHPTDKHSRRWGNRFVWSDGDRLGLFVDHTWWGWGDTMEFTVCIAFSGKRSFPLCHFV